MIKSNRDPSNALMVQLYVTRTVSYLLMHSIHHSNTSYNFRLELLETTSSFSRRAYRARKPSAGLAPRMSSEADPLVQYVALRRDLWKEEKWPLGSIIAQGCHAATAALWISRDTVETREYCAAENLDHMRKVRGVFHAAQLLSMEPV